MRTIVKGPPPSCLTSWISAQVAASLSTSYTSFPNTSQLRADLINEQRGLCAYTGERLDDIPSSIEHIKPQVQCLLEKTTGGLPVGEDVDYDNLVATHKVSGRSKELYGESIRGSWFGPGYVSPLDPHCGDHFDFELDGSITGCTFEGKEMIKNLKLDHDTLNELRRSAIEASSDAILALLNVRLSLSQVVKAITSPQSGHLPAFVFVLEAALPKLE